LLLTPVVCLFLEAIMPAFEFHVSRRARDTYGFDETLFTFNGNVIFANFYAARTFAQKINAKRSPDRTVKAAQLNALGLIDELQHYTLKQYREQKNPRVMQEALDYLTAQIGPDEVEKTLRRFVDEFPPVAVYKGEIAIDDYLRGETNGTAHHQIELEEMLMLWLANQNPAFEPYRELFDDAPLRQETAYPQVMIGLREFFASQPAFGPNAQNLLDFLRLPALAAPDSLIAQLEFMRGRWGITLGPYLYRMLGGLDFIREEEKAIFTGPGPTLVPVFGAEAQQASLALFGPTVGSSYDFQPEPERFSVDLHWMPRLVLIAKNTYVWLDQLSKKYQRTITRLDQIPDEELDQLRRWGFTGLWLIGLWERSRASQRIKQMMGNPEAVASAYSLMDYRIADDLGGDAALQDLRDRARRRGIRLSSDMVPNHMGVDSNWVIEHPDWFIALDNPPFPSYTFNGPDWSWDGRVGLYLEDHYFNHSDAAVVFKRVDKWTGSTKYIYHGNDGTSFPWNDTAQLDYLKPEVREAVIQTILHVARNFPVIRFDAAMTLAKRHFQRLWFPEPGTGGAIPSRAEYGLTKDQFDAAIPEEFWREVVDRVAAEAPNTLLLAEAFWLMEGYFVRTLGMHRVYNSAFMNLLRDEDNGKYRVVMKNTMEFDPEVLRRYVNFMNNPDEKTAVEQFGKGDKYFGVCVLMSTMPGLPMFGHGQMEGFSEKYGMEYRRAYYNETPDQWLIDRHAREIFPLLHKRYVFAGVEDFLLYDVYTPEGYVDENVFAYSNSYESEKALVVYHNRFADTRGWIHTSAAYAVKTGSGDEKTLVQRELKEGLGLRAADGVYYIFRDQITGLEYIRNGRELCQSGFFIQLRAYEYHVFMDWREVIDDEQRRYAQIAAYLQGGGTPSVDDAIRELYLQPVHGPFKELVNAGMFNWLYTERVSDATTELSAAVGDEVAEKATRLFKAINDLNGSVAAEADLARSLRDDLEAIMQLLILSDRFAAPTARKYQAAIKYLRANLGVMVEEAAPKSKARTATIARSLPADDKAIWGTLFGWVMVHSLGKALAAEDYAVASRAWIDEWFFGRILATTLREFGLEEGAATRAVGLIKVLTSQQEWFDAAVPAAQRPAQVLTALLADQDAARFLQVNRYNEIDWYNKESFEELLAWLMLIEAVKATVVGEDVPKTLGAAYDVIAALQLAEAQSDYQVEKLTAAVKPAAKTKTSRTESEE
jgi:glycosidase